MPREDIRRGALLMTVSALLFAVMAAAVSLAERDIALAPIVFFRHLLMLLFLLPWVLRQGRRGLATQDLRGHLVRGIAGLLAVSCFFYAIARLRLADAVLLNQSLPLFIPLVERAWLGERVPRPLWGVLALGFAGLLLILRPGFGVFEPAALVGIASAVFAAVAQVGIRRLTRTEPVMRIVVYFGLVASALALPPAVVWWTPPAPSTWLLLLLMAAFATVGQLTLTRGYVYAPAARVGPFLYTGPVFAGVIDWLLWGRLPDLMFVAGALLVIAAATLALRLRGAPPLAAA